MVDWRGRLWTVVRGGRWGMGSFGGWMGVRERRVWVGGWVSPGSARRHAAHHRWGRRERRRFDLGGASRGQGFLRRGKATEVVPRGHAPRYQHSSESHLASPAVPHTVSFHQVSSQGKYPDEPTSASLAPPTSNPRKSQLPSQLPHSNPSRSTPNPTLLTIHNTHHLV